MVLINDWQQPLVVAVKPTPVPELDRVRDPATPALRRRMLVVWSYVRNSGMFTDFSTAAEPHVAIIARAFRPTVVWGVFGNTDCWLLAQRLARLAECRWVSDMKDAWDSFMPFGLRTLVARRFRNMRAATANSHFHASSLARWFPIRADVVYSGVEAGWLLPVAAPGPADGFRVMLVGGTYSEAHLAGFIRGLDGWLRTLPEADRQRVSLCYAGSDAASVATATEPLTALIRVDVRPYVPLPELADLCRTAAVNAYIWSAATFHHKLVELLCCRRPVISFPGERDESVALARRAGGSLNVCADESALEEVFKRIWRGELQPRHEREPLEHLTWSAQAVRLERVLQRVDTGEPAWIP
jgi:hypothetical protein